jgi:hypothetical protein
VLTVDPLLLSSTRGCGGAANQQHPYITLSGAYVARKRVDPDLYNMAYLGVQDELEFQIVVDAKCAAGNMKTLLLDLASSDADARSENLLWYKGHTFREPPHLGHLSPSPGFFGSSFEASEPFRSEFLC